MHALQGLSVRILSNMVMQGILGSMGLGSVSKVDKATGQEEEEIRKNKQEEEIRRNKQEEEIRKNKQEEEIRKQKQ